MSLKHTLISFLYKAVPIFLFFLTVLTPVVQRSPVALLIPLLAFLVLPSTLSISFSLLSLIFQGPKTLPALLSAACTSLVLFFAPQNTLRAVESSLRATSKHLNHLGDALNDCLSLCLSNVFPNVASLLPEATSTEPKIHPQESSPPGGESVAEGGGADD